MITIDNYFSEVKPIDFPALPEALRKGHEYVQKVAGNGESWQAYHDSEAIHKVIDMYLSKLNTYLKETAVKGQTSKVSNKDKSTSKEQQNKSKAVQQRIKKTSHETQAEVAPQPTLVERIPEELRFIRRFVNLHGKTKTKEEILRFLNSLQKAILEKRIRKTSQYADQVRMVQEKLIEVYNTMKAKIQLEINPTTYNDLKLLAGQEKVLPSIGFIKRYIALNGKAGMKEKAKQLLTQINRALDKARISEHDPYTTEIHEIKKNLKSFTTSKALKTLQIEKATLNGLEGILGCACDTLHGYSTKPPVMNSMEFASMEFDTIGLTGKWHDLIGDPSPNFTAMVFGKPKMGKSYLCIEFAGYLARHHGKVLYVAREEGLDRTLQIKLNDKEVAHPNLDVASILPDDLKRYDFIFLDSVNRLGLDPADLHRLRSQYPGKSFIYVFQSTKEGKFRGVNTFQHDVDVVIEVPENGRAVQMGRFNQGGEISIFDEA